MVFTGALNQELLTTSDSFDGKDEKIVVRVYGEFSLCQTLVNVTHTYIYTPIHLFII